MATPVTAIFDIGKTNKKFYLFDRDLNELHHSYQKFPLIADDDGYPCDDLNAITTWIKKTVEELISSTEYNLVAVNFSTYGATLVHLDEEGKPVTPLYNYLKPFPEEALKSFTSKYGQESNDVETASPFLGMLNSGLQLYWLKYFKPDLFRKIKTTLHFPQYLSYIFTGKLVSEPTSIGCHTKLWDFEKNSYHSWLKEEEMLELFPTVMPTTTTYDVKVADKNIIVGIGIHDSSSALASYQLRIKEPFLLVSTGTWSICLNPFVKDPLTTNDLKLECLYYLSITGDHVKSSRLFLGNELDHQLKSLNKLFNTDPSYYKNVKLNKSFLQAIEEGVIDNNFYPSTIENAELIKSVLRNNRWDPSSFSSFDEAYHHVIWGFVLLQIAAIRLAAGNTRFKKVYVDGGFIDNDIYIKLLRYYLPEYDLQVSDQPLGSSMGAALVLGYDRVKSGEVI